MAPNPHTPLGPEAGDEYLSVLREVEHPARYVGGEVGAITKPWEDCAVKACLVFPDAYEIGISNMGLQILYQIVNGRPDALAERAYAPWPDYERALRRRNLPLRSLEGKRALRDFDLIGIAIPYELTFTNILNVIDLGGIPLETARRDRRHPVVIGGGAAVYNPEPVSPFFDAFVIGDGEEVIHEVLDCVKQWRAGRDEREALHLSLARIPGVYVPSLYEIAHHPDGTVAAIVPLGGAPEKVERRVVADLDAAYYPTAPIVPTARAVFERVNVEVTRGCTHGCRFCQAGFTYRPVRERSPERVKELVLDSLKNTGYDEVTLASLSTGDYLCLYPLLKDLVDETHERKVGYSLPSLRIGTLTPAVVRQIKRVTKTGFTMAPEAGSERLRQVINKPISEDDLLAAVRNVFTEGWPEIKFYFMYGLPTEEDGDLDGIVRLAQRTLAVGRELPGRPRGVKVSTSVYVPKPMTPFQWIGQMPQDELRRRRAYLRERLFPIRMARFTWKSEPVARLEAVFSRGDRRVAGALRIGFERGLRMEAWDEHCDTDAWEKVFVDAGIDPAFYAERHIPVDETLPWDMIDCGTDKPYFAADLARAKREGTIRDCRYGLCGRCGVCTSETSGELVVPRVYTPEGEPAQVFSLPMVADTVDHPLVPEVRAPEPPPVAVPEGARFTYRLRWTKLGALAHVSHLEMVALFMRSLRRADLPIALTLGRHPRPRLSFGPALALGAESLYEVLDVTLTEDLEPATLQGRLNEVLPEGAAIVAAVPLKKGARGLGMEGLSCAYEAALADPPKDLEGRVRAALDRERIEVERLDKKGRPQVRDLRPCIARMEAQVADGSGALSMLLDADGSRAARVVDVLQAALGLGPAGTRIRRTGLYFVEDGRYYELMDAGRARPVDPAADAALTHAMEAGCLSRS
jgi:radical SAM family uncharacterized protein/radical SAM-linked protein